MASLERFLFLTTRRRKCERKRVQAGGVARLAHHAPMRGGIACGDARNGLRFGVHAPKSTDPKQLRAIRPTRARSDLRSRPRSAACISSRTKCRPTRLGRDQDGAAGIAPAVPNSGKSFSGSMVHLRRTGMPVVAICLHFRGGTTGACRELAPPNTFCQARNHGTERALPGAVTDVILAKSPCLKTYGLNDWTEERPVSASCLAMKLRIVRSIEQGHSLRREWGCVCPHRFGNLW